MIARNRKGQILPRLTGKNIKKMLGLSSKAGQGMVRTTLSRQLKTDANLRYNFCQMAEIDYDKTSVSFVEAVIFKCL